MYASIINLNKPFKTISLGYAVIIKLINIQTLAIHTMCSVKHSVGSCDASQEA